MSVMSATFTSLAYNLTTLRERGILKRLRGTPMPTSAYLAGLAGNAMANALLQLVIVILAGHFLLGVSWPRDWVAMAVFAAAGVICFALLGVALSHAIPNPESAPAYVNAVFLPQILIAGVFYDAAEAPQIIRDIAQACPSPIWSRAVGRDGRRRGHRRERGLPAHPGSWGAPGPSSRSAASPGKPAARDDAVCIQSAARCRVSTRTSRHP